MGRATLYNESCSSHAFNGIGDEDTMSVAMDRYERLRNEMVDEQILARGINDRAVIAAMRRIPRHLYVDASLRDRAYGDYPLSIGQNQTISQPYIVALMTQALHLMGREQILEIGTGSGYQTAILSSIVVKVYTIERNTVLYRQSLRRFSHFDISNIVSRCSDGTLGWKENSPFDGVIVTAGGPAVPKFLIQQLKPGGYLVMPVGDQVSQTLWALKKTKNGLIRKSYGECRFVKLIGEFGWPRSY